MTEGPHFYYSEHGCHIYSQFAPLCQLDIVTPIYNYLHISLSHICSYTDYEQMQPNETTLHTFSKDVWLSSVS